MADYYAKIRSNYFRVKNADAFQEWLSNSEFGGEEIEMFQDETDGTVGFLGCATIPTTDEQRHV